MYVVLGASGNTGHVVVEHLLNSGKKVRVLGRNADHLQFLAAKGAEIFVADATDAQSLTKAFHQAESAYVLIPPNPTSNDPLAFSERVSDAIAASLKNTGVKNVVALSSIGADKANGTGPVIGLHNLEQKLNQLSVACGLSRQTDPGIARSERSQLHRSDNHHRKGNRQTRPEIYSASRRSDSSRDGSHGDVREDGRVAAGNVGRTQFGTHAATRTSELAQYHHDNI